MRRPRGLWPVVFWTPCESAVTGTGSNLVEMTRAECSIQPARGCLCPNPQDIGHKEKQNMKQKQEQTSFAGMTRRKLLEQLAEPIMWLALTGVYSVAVFHFGFLQAVRL